MFRRYKYELLIGVFFVFPTQFSSTATPKDLTREESARRAARRKIRNRFGGVRNEPRRDVHLPLPARPARMIGRRAHPQDAGVCGAPLEIIDRMLPFHSHNRDRNIQANDVNLWLETDNDAILQKHFFSRQHSFC